MDFKSLIHDVPDFPKKGVIFRDITPILQDPRALWEVANALADFAERGNLFYGKVAGIESRGFILGSVVAICVQAGFVPIRKGGKLPRPVWSEEFELEYGRAIVDIHKDALEPGERVLIVDDVLATGGTALAAAKLVEKAGGVVDQIICLIEIEALKGREALKGYNVSTLVQF